MSIEEMAENYLSLKQVYKDPLLVLATGFGCGLVKKAPGTAGTLLAVPAAILLGEAAREVYVIVVFLLFIIGIPICNYAGNKLGNHDSPAIVLDEIVGYLIVASFLPNDYLWLFCSFILFRLLDIYKFSIIKKIDSRYKNGFGVMLDDALAGILSLIILVSLQEIFFL